MSREWTERGYQKLCLTGNMKEERKKEKEAFPEEPAKMGYIQRWVRES